MKISNALEVDTAFYNDRKETSLIIKAAKLELNRLSELKKLPTPDLPFITGMETGIKALIKNVYVKYL